MVRGATALGTEGTKYSMLENLPGLDSKWAFTLSRMACSDSAGFISDCSVRTIGSTADELNVNPRNLAARATSRFVIAIFWDWGKWASS